LSLVSIVFFVNISQVTVIEKAGFLHQSFREIGWEGCRWNDLHCVNQHVQPNSTQKTPWLFMIMLIQRL